MQNKQSHAFRVLYGHTQCRVVKKIILKCFLSICSILKLIYDKPIRDQSGEI